MIGKLFSQQITSHARCHGPDNERSDENWTEETYIAKINSGDWVSQLLNTANT